MASLVLNGLTVTYDGRSVVTVYQRGVSGNDFDRVLSAAYSVRGCFARSKPGSDWGCDGIGYQAQRQIGEIKIHRSGVGPRKFKQACERIGTERMSAR